MGEKGKKILKKKKRKEVCKVCWLVFLGHVYLASRM